MGKLEELEAMVKVNMQNIKQLNWEKLQLEARIEELENPKCKHCNNSVGGIVYVVDGNCFFCKKPVSEKESKNEIPSPKEDSLEEVLEETLDLSPPHVAITAQAVRKWIKDRLPKIGIDVCIDELPIDYEKEINQRLGLNEGSDL